MTHYQVQLNLLYRILGNTHNQWVLYRYAQMNDMNDGPAWGLNSRLQSKCSTTELTGLANNSTYNYIMIVTYYYGKLW